MCYYLNVQFQDQRVNITNIMKSRKINLVRHFARTMRREVNTLCMRGKLDDTNFLEDLGGKCSNIS